MVVLGVLVSELNGTSPNKKSAKKRSMLLMTLSFSLTYTNAHAQ